MTSTSTSTAVEHYAGPLELTDGQWAQLERTVKVLASSTVIPKRFQGKPGDLTAVGLACLSLQMDLNPMTAKQAYVIDGTVNWMAQLQIAIADRYGYDVWLPDEECTEEAATVHIRKPGRTRVDLYTYTIDMARKAHHLDEWYELWAKEDGKWRLRERFVVRGWESVNGKAVRVEREIPAWARGKPLKRKDPYHDNLRQMLMNRAVTLGLKFAASAALLGLGPALGFSPIRTDEQDEEVIDGEVVDEGPEIAVAPPRPVGEATGGPDPQAADDWDRQALASRVDDLDEEWRAVARQRWMAARIPAPNSGDLTKAHVEEAADLLGTIEAEAAETYDRRRKRANAVMGEVGIRSDQARHECVHQATEGRTESTARLSSADIEAVVAACESMRAEEAPPHDEEPAGEDDPGAPFE